MLEELPINPRIKLTFKGAFLSDHYDDISSDYLYFFLSLDSYTGESQNISEILKLPMVEMMQLDTAKEIKRNKIIHLNDSDYQSLQQNKSILKLNLFATHDASVPINLSYDPSPLDKELGIILAAIVLLGLYILIIWELVHRTFAAMVASTLAIGILAAMNERPTMALVVSWIDVETLLLLFGMMILVAVLSETGVFDYLAVYAFKVSDKRFSSITMKYFELYLDY